MAVAPASARSLPTRREAAAVVGVSSMAVAAGAHLAAFPAQRTEGGATAAFFIAAAGVQVAAALILHRGPGIAARLAIVAGNVGLLALWANARLASNAEHPVLSELLARIMRQEGRHIDFYARQARQRLSGSRAAQRVTRFALKRLWSPVGTGVRPLAEVNFVVAHLFGGQAGYEAGTRIDRRIDQLPGLAGLQLVNTARATAGAT